MLSVEWRDRDLLIYLGEPPLQIAHYLDPDHLLGRAHRSGNESVFRRLIEIALTHNLDDYEKTRFFEGLLVFQCKFSFQCGQSLVLSTRPDIEIETREFKLGDISSTMQYNCR